MQKGLESAFVQSGEGKAAEICVKGAKRTIETFPSHSERRRGDSYKLKVIRQDIRKKIFTMSLVRHWKGLPTEFVTHPWKREQDGL